MEGNSINLMFLEGGGGSNAFLRAPVVPYSAAFDVSYALERAYSSVKEGY